VEHVASIAHATATEHTSEPATLGPAMQAPLDEAVAKAKATIDDVSSSA
jgi:3-oxoacyl-(acyl-carrier-protein) synthase